MDVDEKLRAYPFEEFRGELPAELVRMGGSAPVSRVRLPDGRPAWLVLGYDEVCTVLADPRFVRHAVPADSSTVDGGCPMRELNMNGPAHASLRRLAARPFTARRVEAFRPRVTRLTEELLDAMAAAGPPADLIASFVAPLPIMFTCTALGVPVEDRSLFEPWAAAMLSTTGNADAAGAEAQMRAYLADRLAQKRREPGEDLLSGWLEAQRREELTDEEIVGLAFGVLLGGRELNSLSAGVFALLRHPAQLAALRADPGLLPGAVEEILRYCAVSAMFVVHTVAREVDLAGHRLAVGDAVMSMPWVANRQPDVFPDADTFDIHRVQNPHLSFGHGPHFCLGAALGRMQLEVGLAALLRRFPALAPAVALEELPWRDDRVAAGIAEFPVTW